MSSPDLIRFSFCQVSDLLLDSGAAISLHLSPAQRRERIKETLDALARAMDEARDRNVDAVIIPGNLFDENNITTRVVATVQEIFTQLGNIPVFITPGAIDPYSNDSAYDDASLQARGLKPWPPNVHIFGRAELETVSLPGKASIKISGLAIQKHMKPFTQATVPKLPDSEKLAINVMLLPLPEKELAVPELSDHLTQEIRESGFSYLAISGPKNQIRFCDGDQNIRAVATGTFIGQSAAETGPRTLVFGNLDRQLDGTLNLSIENREFDPRRIVELNFEIGNMDTSKVGSKLAEIIADCGARAEKQDILILRISGLFPGGCAPVQIDDALKDSFFQLLLIDKSRPDYLQNTSNENTIESRFIEILNLLKQKAEAEANYEELEIIENAVYFGLEAIRESKVSIRDAS